MKLSTGKSWSVRRGEHPGDDFRIGCADAQYTAFNQQPLTRRLLQVVPSLVGTAQERNVIGMLEIGLADDARFAVRAAAAMPDGELLDSQYAVTAPGQFKGGRRPHAAQPEHDDVVGFHPG